jgi:hypothetical protein
VYDSKLCCCVAVCIIMKMISTKWDGRGIKRASASHRRVARQGRAQERSESTTDVIVLLAVYCRSGSEQFNLSESFMAGRKGMPAARIGEVREGLLSGAEGRAFIKSVHAADLWRTGQSRRSLVGPVWSGSRPGLELE